MDTGVETASFYKWSSKDDGGLDYRSGLPSCGLVKPRGQTGLCCGNSPVHTQDTQLIAVTHEMQGILSRVPWRDPPAWGQRCRQKAGDRPSVLVEAGPADELAGE